MRRPGWQPHDRAKEGIERVTQSPHIFLLTGVPGVGKTTVIRRLADGLAGVRLGGFYTEELRAASVRQGFRLVGFDGSECVIAHVDIRGAPRVSKYGVDVAVLEDAAARLLAPRPDIDLYLVDEIGKMECLSEVFVFAMRKLLNSGRPVVATVALKGAGFIAQVKRRADARLFEVTRANRERLPQKLCALLADAGIAAR